MSFSFEYMENGEKEGERWVGSYRNRQGLCGQVSTKGHRVQSLPPVADWPPDVTMYGG